MLVLDGGIGSDFSEVKDGVYTGKPTGLFVYRSDKARAIRQLAEREGIDLDASYAYSDSESDLPMLQAVGHPVAVNPDRELARVAREQGWEVLRFDRLGRRMKAAVAFLGAAAAGGVGSAVLAMRGETVRVTAHDTGGCPRSSVDHRGDDGAVTAQTPSSS